MYAEQSGSFVNHADWLQSFAWAVRPPLGVWTPGNVYWHLLARPGLYNPRPVMEELASRDVYFSPAASSVPAEGVPLISVAVDQPVEAVAGKA
jgi:hypothetical protein